VLEVQQTNRAQHRRAKKNLCDGLFVKHIPAAKIV
jgi:hypothetical protein